MAILAKNSDSNFTPAPEGQFQGVCVDVVDLGLVEREYNGEKKMRHEVRVIFQLGARGEDGKEIRTENGSRFTVSSLFGLSLSKKGNLRPFLESWRGRQFTESELEAGFDVEKLIGANALIQVVHNQSGDTVYANISSIRPWNLAWGEKLTPENYLRKTGREPQPPSPPAGASAPKSFAPAALKGARAAITQDDIPF